MVDFARAGPPRYVCTDCDARDPSTLSPCRHALAGSSPDGLRRLSSRRYVTAADLAGLVPPVLTPEQADLLARGAREVGDAVRERGR